MELKDIFLRIASVGAPSGYEEPMMRALKSELAPYVDEVYDTPRGNVVGVKRGTDKEAPSVALVAHTDQIGFAVHNIDDRGFVRFRRIGGPVTRALLGQQVRILTEKGSVPGVVGVKPGHITTPEEARTVPSVEEMYIDVGAWSRREAEAMGVKVGTPIVYGVAPVELANDLIASPGVDDRGGVTALIGVAKALKGESLPSTVYYIGTVEEEMGLRGAAVALFNLDVDLAVAIDTCAAGYQPEVSMRDLIYEIGKGPSIHVGEVNRTNVRAVHHHKVREWLVEAAEAEGILFQSAFMHGGTDAKAVAQTRGGIPSSTIGLPRRYSHSPVELFDLKDLENLVNILVAALKRLGSEFKLLRA